MEQFDLTSSLLKLCLDLLVLALNLKSATFNFLFLEFISCQDASQMLYLQRLHIHLRFDIIEVFSTLLYFITLELVVILSLCTLCISCS